MIRSIKVGSVTVTSLCFATATRSREDLSRVFPSLSEQRLDAVHATHPQGYAWSFNGTLINLGDTVMVVDTGFGFESSEHGTGIRPLLAEAGLEPEDVTHIVITHGHGDHVGGMLFEDEPSFPDSELVVGSVEREYWMGRGDSPAKHAFAAYADQTREIAADELIASGGECSVRAIPLPGHTPGQIGLEVRCGESCVRLLADTIHTTFQLTDLDLSPRFDAEPKVAADTRKRVLAEVARENQLVSLFHFPFPGFGRLAENAGGLQWRSQEAT